jgi:hypothetical protein
LHRSFSCCMSVCLRAGPARVAPSLCFCVAIRRFPVPVPRARVCLAAE